jgi:hypothetical protein
MNRWLFLRHAVAILSVSWCLVACGASVSQKLDPALEGYSKENLTFSVAELGIIEPGTPTREPTQVNWVDASTVEIKTVIPDVNCADWIDVGYQLVDHQLRVKTIVGQWVTKDGGGIIAMCHSDYEVTVIISQLPMKDYEVQLRTGQAMEPRISHSCPPECGVPQ